MKKILLLCGLMFSFSYGITYTSVSCSRIDVSYAISLANDGDTVIIPSCQETDYTTWNDSIGIKKAIILIGCGIDSTKIKSNYTSGDGLGLIRYIPTNPDSNHRFEMKNFSINTDSKCIALSFLNTTIIPEYINIHDLKITCNTKRAFYISGTIFGVIHSNDIKCYIAFSTYGYDTLQWHALYTNPPQLTRNYGDKYNLYFEDNIVDAGTDGYFSDGGQGGRRVLRYNNYTVDHAVGMIDFHGNQPAGSVGNMNGGNCGSMVGEIYGNKLIDSRSGSYCQVLDQRGGQILFFINSIKTGQPRSTSQAREECTDSLWPRNFGWVQKVTNSYHWLNINNDTHLVVTYIDPIENGGANNATTWIPEHLYGSASSSSDIYNQRWTNDPNNFLWKKTQHSNNTGTMGGLVSPYLTGTIEPNWDSVSPRFVISDGNIHWLNLGGGSPIAINEDLWVQTRTGIFDGSGDSLKGGGVGYGQLNNIPQSGLIGVGYWVTNQNYTNIDSFVGVNPKKKINGTLYKRTVNGWIKYYTPYEYPHPLRCIRKKKCTITIK